MFRHIAATAGVLAAATIVSVSPMTTGPSNAIIKCDDGQFYSTSYVGEKWRLTAAHDDWATAGQRSSIRTATTSKNTVRTITTNTVSAKVKAGWGPISAEINATHTKTNDVSHTTQKSISVGHAITIPRGKIAMQARWARGKIYKVRAYHMYPAHTASGSWTCAARTDYTAKISFPAHDGPFVWDLRDKKTGRPACKVRGYVSYGTCRKILN